MIGGATVVLAAVLVVVNGFPYKSQDDNGTEIVLTHVIFRHGERTTYHFYPNDPNKNDTFFPIGRGGLTNAGKMGEFELGQFLRKEYGSLLGTYYTDDIIDARSTDTTRTKQSAQLVLAGLFPPNKDQQWNNELNWQPIPVYFKRKVEEDVIHPEECPTKLMLDNQTMKNPEAYEKFIKPYEKFFNFIETKSGMEIRNIVDLIEFYFTVNTEIDLHMPVPSWVHEIYPEPLYTISTQSYAYQNFFPEQRKINAGYLLQKIIIDTLMKIDPKSPKRNMRMFLYSGHETTIGFMMHALGILKPHIPPYGSALMFELHKNNEGQYFMKIRYRDGTFATKAKQLSIPGCDVLCPLQKFIDLQKDLLPRISVHEACKL